MKKRSAAGIRRLTIIVVTVAGLLGLLAATAHAIMTQQHCEPVQRR